MSTAAPTRLWRTQPKYEGLCSDGWYQTPDGRLHFRPNPKAALDVAKAKLFCLLEELDDLPARPLIVPVAIGGRRPTAAQVAAIEAELRKVPPTVIAAFRQAGGQIQVVGGQDCRHHPLYPPERHIPAGMVVSGFLSRRPLLIVVAAEADPAVTLHEIGHFCDGPPSCRFSESISWAIHREQVAELCDFSPYHKSSKAEAFAQTFREWCRGAELPEPARRLLRRAVART
jgi:hypothetical protein